MTRQRVTFDRFDKGMDVRKRASVADANRLQVLENAYVTSGYAVRKRPGLVKRFSIPSGAVGLQQVQGKVLVFHHQTSDSYAGFEMLALPHPSQPELALRDVPFAQVFDGFLYCVAVYANGTIFHHYLDGQTPSAITDPNNPRSLAVCITGGHVFAAAGEVVRFCALSDPNRAGSGARDWSSPRLAGFLPTGNNRTGTTLCTALGVYRRSLAVAFSDGLQLWQADPDPNNMRLISNVESSGSRYPRTMRAAFNDLFYLGDGGFKSVSVQGSDLVERESDVGAPVDKLILQSLRTLKGQVPVFSAFYAKAGQYWTVIGDDVWVYTYSRTSRLAAWSRYTFPLRITAMTELNGTLLIRSGSDCFTLDDEATTDDGVLILVRMLMPFLDFGAHGLAKQIQGFDVVIEGVANVRFRYDPNRPELHSTPVQCGGDTRVNRMHPVEIVTTSIAPEFLHERAEAFQLDQLILFFNSLGPV
jgi:hypothetical protein